MKMAYIPESLRNQHLDYALHKWTSEPRIRQAKQKIEKMKLDVKTQKKAKVGFYEVNFYNFKEKVK